MRIAIIGTGGLGGYFGARLASGGADVRFLARGATLEAMLHDGLRIEGTKGELHVKPVRASSDPAELGPVDLVPFAVKLWDSESTIAAIRPLMKGDTTIVSLQNGVRAADLLSRAF